jgi:hypothetical protein
MTDRGCLRLSVLSAIVGLLIVGSPLPSFADERCSQLEMLSQQYAGVELSLTQRAIKRRLVVWYDRNCRVRRTAQN